MLKNLQAMDEKALRTLANEQGLKVHHKLSKNKIIKAIVDNVDSSNVIPSALERPEPKEVSYLTEDEVRQAFAKLPQLQLVFDEGDKTVTISYKGREECFNLSVPLKTLVSRGSLIARGALRLMGHAPTEFDSLGQTGKNAYTNTVLA